MRYLLHSPLFIFVAAAIDCAVAGLIVLVVKLMARRR